MMKKTPRLSKQLRLRSGFTLIELLVVISIILIILGMTASAISYSREKDRVSNEASRIQSFIAGARDRAIFEKEMRGVRLFVEPAPPGSPAGASAFSRTVASMAYIAPGGTWASPKDSAGVDLLRLDLDDGGTPPMPDGDFDDPGDSIRIVRGQNNPGWWNLKRRGWLVDGLRIRIPAGPTGNWYTIDTSLIDISVAPTDEQRLILQIPYAFSGNKGQEVAEPDLNYEIELPPRILPLQPLLLANGVVIDLDGSDIPRAWRPLSTGNSQYSGFMDLWFSPRGNIVGDAAANGLLHLQVCDLEDALFLKEQFVNNVTSTSLDSFVQRQPFVPMEELIPATTPWLTADDTYVLKDRGIVTIFGQTGNITINRVNSYVNDINGGSPDTMDPDDLDNDGNTNESDGLADDPFLFAETGKEAK